MGKSQPTYTKEFKQEAVKLFETSGKTKTQKEIVMTMRLSKAFGEH